MKDRLKLLGKPFLNNKGMALVTVLVVSTVLALVGNSYLSSSTVEVAHLNENIEREQAFYVAEAGLEYAKNILKNGSEWKEEGWELSGVNAPAVGSNTSGTFDLNFYNYDEDTQIGYLDSVGKFKGYEKTLSLKVKAFRKSPYQLALCGCNANSDTTSLSIGSGSIDSFDGSVGPYGGDNVSFSGNVGSNSHASIGNANISGKVIAAGNLSGTGATVTGDVLLGGANNMMDASVSGTITENFDHPVPQPCDCTTLCVADLADFYKNPANNDNVASDFYTVDGYSHDFTINGNNTYTFTAGTYYFTSFKINGNATVVVDNSLGSVTFIFDDVNSDPENPGGQFKFTGTGMTNSTGNAKGLRIISNSVSEIKLAGTADFTGTIFAPKATVKLRGNFTVYGSVYADIIDMNGSGGGDGEEGGSEEVGSDESGGCMGGGSEESGSEEVGSDESGGGSDESGSGSSDESGSGSDESASLMGSFVNRVATAVSDFILPNAYAMGGGRGGGMGGHGGGNDESGSEEVGSEESGGSDESGSEEVGSDESGGSESGSEEVGSDESGDSDESGGGMGGHMGPGCTRSCCMGGGDDEGGGGSSESSTVGVHYDVTLADDGPPQEGDTAIYVEPLKWIPGSLQQNNGTDVPQ